MHEVGLGKVEAFARAAASDDYRVEVSPVLSSVQTHAHILRKQLILLRPFIPVFLVHGSGVAPLGRTVFLTPAVVAPGGEINADAHSIRT